MNARQSIATLNAVFAANPKTKHLVGSIKIINGEPDDASTYEALRAYVAAVHSDRYATRSDLAHAAIFAAVIAAEKEDRPVLTREDFRRAMSRWPETAHIYSMIDFRDFIAPDGTHEIGITPESMMAAVQEFRRVVDAMKDPPPDMVAMAKVQEEIAEDVRKGLRAFAN